MTALVKYEAARAALSAAVRVDEVKSIRDKAQAMAAYARQAKDTALIEWATEIKVRAERRAGEMLAGVERSEGGRGKTDSALKSVYEEHDIAPVTAHRWQKLAAIPEDKFEQAVAAAKETAREVTTAHMLRVASELKATRDLQQQLKDARDHLDPASKADAAWMPITLAITSLHARINEAKRLPKCPQKTCAELREMFTAVSRFLSPHLEIKT